VQTNKTDLAFTGSSFIYGDGCNYKFYGESNTLVSDCFDNEGMFAGSQMRILQQPYKVCNNYQNIYVLGLTLNDISRLYVMDKTGTYRCCDYFEPGTGYLFTDCGGK
jgi:hypothetical protein